MATEENDFSLSLEDLPSDVLSVVLFHLSSKDVLSLSATSSQMFKNVKAAKQMVLKSAQELVKSLSVTDTVTTFIEDLDKAIRYAHEVRALSIGAPITYQEVCMKIMALTRSYGYEVLECLDIPGFAPAGIGHVVTPSKLKISLEWGEDRISCTIDSDDEPLANFFAEAATYQFSKSIFCNLRHIAYKVCFGNSYRTHFALSTAASLKEIVQSAADIGAIELLYRRWSENNVLNVDIYHDETMTRPYGLNLTDGQIEKYVVRRLSLSICIDDVDPEIVQAFRFLHSLIETQRSE